MRDREFTVAKKALVEGTEDKATIPDRFSLVGDKVLYGKRRKVHTLVIPVAAPAVRFDHANLKVVGGGRVLADKDVEVHSWVRNHYNRMVTVAGATAASDGVFGDGNINVKDTGNNVRSHANASIYLDPRDDLELETGNDGYNVSVGHSASGVLVGTGTTAEGEDGYALTTPVAHGNGAGQLYHATAAVPAPDVWDGGSSTFSYELTRYFDNFSGGSITLKEMCQVVNIGVGYSFYDVMVARDLIDAPTGLAVPFRAQAAISYTYSLTYGSGSPLRNFYNYIFSNFASLSCDDGTVPGDFGAGNLNLLDTANTLRTSTGAPSFWDASVHSATYGYRGTANTDAHGIVVGSDSTAVDFDNYIPNAKIAHGAGAGELQYGLGEVPNRSWADPTMTVSHARTFANSSGGNVTVRESGLIARLTMGSTSLYIFILHDTFSDVVIADGEDLRVVYQIQVDYP